MSRHGQGAELMASFEKDHVEIDVTLNLQLMYDCAVAMAAAWTAMAQSLAKTDCVCTHPLERHIPAGPVVMCAECDSVLHMHEEKS